MLELLKYAKYGDGKYIDIAKGKYQLATNLRQAWETIKRELRWQ